jgi:(4S)-4-hydroxy-5-phosphonooxypentane-2,3-dione isomerase
LLTAGARPCKTGCGAIHPRRKWYDNKSGFRKIKSLRHLFEETMYAVCIHLHVKPECLDAFLEVTLNNARNTIQEPGNLRFDVLQQRDDPNRFMLYEIYRDESEVSKHKETDHYKRWAAEAPGYLAEPRVGIKHAPLFPTQPEQFQTR